MYKLIALWSPPKPADAEAFEKAYLEVHVPKAKALANLAGLETVKMAAGLDGSAPAVGRVAVMIWPDRTAFERDEATEAWRLVREDGGSLVERFGVTLQAFVGEDG